MKAFSRRIGRLYRLGRTHLRPRLRIGRLYRLRYACEGKAKD